MNWTQTLHIFSTQSRKHISRQILVAVMNVKTEAPLVEDASSSLFPYSPGSCTPADGNGSARGGGGFATRHQESPQCLQSAANSSAILVCELSLSTAFNMPWFHTFTYSLLHDVETCGSVWFCVVLCGSVWFCAGSSRSRGRRQVVLLHGGRRENHSEALPRWAPALGSLGLLRGSRLTFSSSKCLKEPISKKFSCTRSLYYFDLF